MSAQERISILQFLDRHAPVDEETILRELELTVVDLERNLGVLEITGRIETRHDSRGRKMVAMTAAGRRVIRGLIPAAPR